jgi:adenylosuccinate synthase
MAHITDSSKQLQIFLDPLFHLTQDFQEIYKKSSTSRLATASRSAIAKKQRNARSTKAAIHTPNIVALFGAQLGDEGKGRFVDNLLETFSKMKKIKKIVVIRFNGGSNAGHSVENHGKKVALHQIPSMVLHKKAVGIMEKGMVVHVEDLQTEYQYVEAIIGKGKLDGRVILSRDAIFCTDIERATEALNAEMIDNAKGGTKRGIGPAYAGYYEKTGLKIADLMAVDWEARLRKYYARKEKIFTSAGRPLAKMLVPDFRASLAAKSAVDQEVGTQDVFIQRLAKVRRWLLAKNIVQETCSLHLEILRNMERYGVIFEGAQGIGLHAWIGTVPDVTASDTSLRGIDLIGPWRSDLVQQSVGVFKATYMSSVGARHMPTEVRLAKTVLSPADLGPKPSADERWAAWVRAEAHEFGTTTGRPRDICFLDLPFMAFNCFKGGITALVATHLDIATEGQKIKICTHYTKAKKRVAYQPGLEYQEGVVPQYIELDGWDGRAVSRAKSFQALPINAQKYCLFLQARLGVPILFATTGPSRENFIKVSG